MRNLKRALSLTLASVMLLGMMVVGAGWILNEVDSRANELKRLSTDALRNF